MKRLEFIKKVEDLGLDIKLLENSSELLIINKDDEIAPEVAIIEDSTEYYFDLFEAYDRLTEDIRRSLFELVTLYSKTTMKDRESDDLYFIIFEGLGENSKYLNEDKNDGTFHFGNKVKPVLEDWFRLVFSNTDIEFLPENIRLGLETGVLRKDKAPEEYREVHELDNN